MIKKLQNLKKSTSPLVFNMACGIITAILFSAFIYLEHFGITLKFFNTIFAVASLALLLYIPKKAVLVAGFFIGLLWFYWIGYSFKYNGVGFLTPFVTFGFALIYMLFFGILSLTNKVYLRAIFLFGLSFFEPFDFNWLQIELIFIDSYLGIFKYQFAMVLFALTLPYYIKNKFKYTPLLLILLSFNFHMPQIQEAPLKIKLIATDLKQERKWVNAFKNDIIAENLFQIQKAINEGYDLVVLPESCFPLFMNTHPLLQAKLEELSYEISIVAGALLYEDEKNYNVTYFFENGNFEIAKKLVLVPFGEYIPLPQFAQKIINDYFFAGQADFSIAKEPTDFIIKGIKFRNAICYEATCQEIYEGDVHFIIATSNNAWFAPSIEPTLQKLLMKYYARKNRVTLYHAANWQGSGVIK
ncbi:apolipoprotein N-acyltransferase [bacterium]|nr:apolipoprotein N-acyltransferase [bacterium]MBU1993159.1 apolipoprotein N-acyltransferase [bacterium]